MLLEAAQYRSPTLDVLLVTDKADALQHVVQRLLLPLNISYHQAQKPPNDNNQYWVTWEHRAAIEQAAAKKNYSTVVYMEDDTRLTWRTLVSWAIDTNLLAAFNVTRCFFRTEVRPADGGLMLMDYFGAIDVRGCTCE
ncbi:hypothetical protein OEZ85_000019 [Tetradesmus obliquus]|uniref:Glycosyl transferase 64 domain-containing protein n=1 Tax=Tetradesmus obliquus TaxID=3088 RepID=A0ABY8UNV2_TETOB|nr:hypothetical protein OEZ85_000019 [Tetradesmus obliquus]